MSKIKEERSDEAEIRELAVKIVEANKAKLAAVQGPTQRITNNQLSSSSSQSLIENDDYGKFGWIPLGKTFIPYVYRQGEKYCAVRMVEQKVLNKYLNYLHSDIYSCTCIRSYYITDAESKLLTEINQRHCDLFFGRDVFGPKDLVVRVSDAIEFYNFLDVCYNKLIRGTCGPKDRCGFIRINKESVVPYTVRGTAKYVPLFYFEGETDNLKLKADELQDWDLSYLKFCCKVQGIRNELFANETCAVISLGDIKSYFPPGTEFEDYWPSKVVDSCLLVASKGGGGNGMWTRQPVAPPQPPPPVVQQSSIASQQQQQQVKQQNNWNQQYNLLRGRQRSMQQYYSSGGIPPLVRSTMAPPNIVGTTSTYTTPSLTSPSYMTFTHPLMAPPPPNPATAYRQVAAAAATNNRFPTNVSLRQQQQQRTQQQQQQQQQQPPPLIPVVNNGRFPSDVIDLSARLSGTTPGVNQKLTILPDAPAQGSHKPFKEQKALVENVLVPCINMKPYLYSELLITIPDLVQHLFPKHSVQTIHKVLEVLGMEMFKGNQQQLQILREAGRDTSLPLVQIREVMNFMPQIKYMCKGNEDNKR